MSTNKRRAAVVEFVEQIDNPEDWPGMISPTVLRINGVDVGLVRQNGLKINGLGGDYTEALSITVELYVSELIIKAEAKPGTEKGDPT